MLPKTSAIDPVCGMAVDPQTAPAKTAHEGVEYYFCCTHCLKKFQADPAKYLHGKPEPMSLGSSLAAASQPGSKRRYVCPMDPDVASDKPGSCPKCGMALEPADVPAENEADPEQAKMVRLFWIAAAFGVPVVLCMLDMTANPGEQHEFSATIQAIFTTAIVLYCGSTFYKRAWTALAQGRLNMFSLIVLGVSTAYLYSLAQLLTGHSGHGDLYFESAAMIVVLVLLGQVLEGRARHATAAAVRQLAGLAPRPPGSSCPMAVSRICLWN